MARGLALSARPGDGRGQADPTRFLEFVDNATPAMHELAITQTIIAIALDHAGQARVLRVAVSIGQLTAIDPEAIRFCFAPCTQGTTLEGAQLDITVVAGVGRCRQCGATIPLEMPFGECSCGSCDLEMLQGEDLLMTEIETEALCV